MPESETSTKDLKYEKLVAVVATLQASIENLKKETATLDTVKHLQPLADGVYDEVLPLKYKRLSFIKFYGTRNLMDYITIFEIKCQNIASNDKLKLQ